MANTKSAEKRARQSLKRNERNSIIRSATKTAVKKNFEELLKASSRQDALKALRAAERVLQKAASKGVYPKERVARKTSKLAAQLNKRFPEARA